MAKCVIAAASAVLALHGPVQLPCAASYMRLAGVKGLAHKTTVHGGRRDLGGR